MARKNKEEQMALIDTEPENAAEIRESAKRYKAALKRRMKALEDETAAKQEILALVKDANLNRCDDGVIRFKLDGMTITVTPRDELVRVKDSDEAED